MGPLQCHRRALGRERDAVARPHFATVRYFVVFVAIFAHLHLGPAEAGAVPILLALVAVEAIGLPVIRQ